MVANMNVSKLLLLILFSHLSLFAIEDPLAAKILQEKCPKWMTTQINEDLSYFQNKPISINKINDILANKPFLYLIKFSIFNNKLKIEPLFEDNVGLTYRINAFKDALRTLCKALPMPNTVFLISMHDGLGADEELPIFVMSKNKNLKSLVLIPDFEILRERYQVLEGIDITQYEPTWCEKQPKMIWRGSTSQLSYDGNVHYIMPDNLHLFSRILLCNYSQLFPELIDAKFTFFAQGAEHIPSLQEFRGDFISFEEQLKYKYHILVDGNACAYSASGWKFFTNSLIFKPNSPLIQWYYNALTPGIHYLPLKENLEDIIDKIQWAMEHDKEAETIAQNARQFAINNLTYEYNLIYIYQLLLQYSQLQFVP